MRDIHTIVIHCTATKEDRSLTRNELKDMHLARGFSDIGYHFYIRKNGVVEKGRHVMFMGAHVKGFNKHSIGIAYEGGLDINGRPKDTRTPEQKAEMERLIKTLKHTLDIKQVVGHRDLSPDLDGDGVVEEHEWLKQCPCFDAIEEYKNI